jgi:hypothetical protein
VAEHFALEAEQLAPLPAEDFAYQALGGWCLSRAPKAARFATWA